MQLVSTPVRSTRSQLFQWVWGDSYFSHLRINFASQFHTDEPSVSHPQSHADLFVPLPAHRPSVWAELQSLLRCFLSSRVSLAQMLVVYSFWNAELYKVQVRRGEILRHLDKEIGSFATPLWSLHVFKLLLRSPDIRPSLANEVLRQPFKILSASHFWSVFKRNSGSICITDWRQYWDSKTNLSFNATVQWEWCQGHCFHLLFLRIWIAALNSSIHSRQIKGLNLHIFIGWIGVSYKWMRWLGPHGFAKVQPFFYFQDCRGVRVWLGFAEVHKRRRHSDGPVRRPRPRLEKVCGWVSDSFI